MENSPHVIGIDLGTTNSVVAVVDSGEPNVINNQEGRSKTPSVVAFDEQGGVTVGEIALRQGATQPRRTICSVKRFIGRMHDEILDEGDLVSFELTADEAGRSAIRVDERVYLPEQISAQVLAKLKQAAEDYLGQRVGRVVLTVPAYFDDNQRQATMEAAKLAGLEVLRLLNEPTAAAMAYGLGRGGRETVAVYDFGGGTFDFSVLDIEDKTFEVLCSNGNSRLGGDDLDTALTDWLADRFQQVHGIDLREDPMTLRRLRDAAERAKCELSSAFETLVSLPFIAYVDGVPIHLEERIEREVFEELAEPYVRETIECCVRGLRQARVRKEDITRVILVGGSTRIPLVQDSVEDFFGLAPFKGINPDEIVALGAAIQGAVMNGELEEVVLLDVTPHTLGIELRGNRRSMLVEKNATIPIKVHKTFSTTEDHQTFVNIHVLQGDSDKANECRSLGRFTLSGIEDAPAGVPRIRVTFFINADGIVEISAADLASGAERSLVISHAYLNSDQRQKTQGEGRRKRRRRRAIMESSDGSGELAPVRARRESTEARRRDPAATGSAGGGATGTHVNFAMIHGDTEPQPVPRQPARSREADERQVVEAAVAGPSAPATEAADSTIGHGPRRAMIPAAAALTQTVTAPPAARGTVPAGSPPAMPTPPATPVTMPVAASAATPVAADVAPREELLAELPAELPAELAPMVEILLEGRRDENACRLYRDARAQFAEFCQQRFDQISLQLLLARLHLFAGEAESSLEVLEQLRMRPEAPTERMLAAYDEFCAQAPDSLAGRGERAELAEQAGQIERAIADLELLVEPEDADPALLARLAGLYRRALGDHSDAAIQFKLVGLHLRLRDIDAAITQLQQLVTLPDHRHRANKLLGLCFWQKGMRHLAWQKLRTLPINDEMKDILYRLADDMDLHDELLHAKYALERIYEVDIQYRDVGERLKKLSYRLELQRDGRYGSTPAPRTGLGTTLESGGELGGRFEIIEEINRGSMGIVYKARDKILDEIVAIKVLNDFLCADQEAIERFKQEARSSRRLTHQNIVRIHDLFDLDGKKFISMEFIEGDNLKTLLARNVTFSDDIALTYLFQICEGLAYAHRLHVVHRDIKPANIMITARNQVKITDFGIAKLLTEHQTKTGTLIMGTPLYMAPEQIEGGRIDHRCDIYALGIMLWEMVMGHPPFNEGNIEYQHVHSPVPEITRTVSEKLRKIILHCVKKRPEERFQTAEEILTRIV